MKSIAAILLMLFSFIFSHSSIAAEPHCNPPPVNGRGPQAAPNCGMTWETYCEPYTGTGVPCNARTFNLGIRYGAPNLLSTPAVPAYAAIGWGFSHAQVATNFGAVQLANFQGNADLDMQFNTIDPATMAQLSVELWRLASNEIGPIYIAAAKRLGAANLAKFSAAFGPSFAPYVAAYAPAAVLAQYRAIKPYPALVYSHNSGVPFPAASDMTYTDLYLDAYTAGQGQSQQVAASKAIRYGQVVFRDKGWLTTLGKWVLTPEGAAVGFIFMIATSADPAWADQLSTFSKNAWAYCVSSNTCGYPPYLIPTSTSPSVEPVSFPDNTPNVNPNGDTVNMDSTESGETPTTPEQQD